MCERKAIKRLTGFLHRTAAVRNLISYLWALFLRLFSTAHTNTPGNNAIKYSDFKLVCKSNKSYCFQFVLIPETPSSCASAHLFSQLVNSPTLDPVEIAAAGVISIYQPGG